MSDTSNGQTKTALILSGGGARAAYQVGVLKAIPSLMPNKKYNPFKIVCGTSAGAINAVALSTHLHDFYIASRRLEAVWRNFTIESIYEADTLPLMKRSSCWIGGMMFGGLGFKRPPSLLDNDPLKHLLKRVINFDRIDKMIDSGQLHALSVNASGYDSGDSISFFQAHPSVETWRRFHRAGSRTEINIEHLMASSAIPVIFPAVRLHREYFGDGAIRQNAPLSPALHLGADRIMTIGAGHVLREGSPRKEVTDEPSFAHIASHILNSAFHDSMEADIERLERVNRTLELIPDNVSEKNDLDLRNVDVLQINPSKSIDDIAERHKDDLPSAFRFFLKGSGATRSKGANIISYLLFVKQFCRELIQLGYDDAMEQSESIKDFLVQDE